LGNAETEEGACTGNSIETLVKLLRDHALPQRTTRNFILFKRFQIALPPGWIGIILHAAGIDPVGASQYPKSELPP
jgi:hypothetical protein